MIIGILTLPLHINYGGILQAYALQTVLERMGHRVDVIEFYDESEPIFSTFRRYKSQMINLSKRIIKRFVLRRNVYIFLEREKKKLIPITHQHTNRFIENYIHLVRYDSPRCLTEKSYDVYVVGSDQVWRPMYSPNIYHAFLDFTEGWKVKRIAYAPSFGSDRWEYSSRQTVKCKHLIKFFDMVSVREDSAVALCEEKFETNAVQLLDPTFLLNRVEYERLIASYDIYKSDGELFNYILDETDISKSLIDYLSSDLGIIPYKVNVWEPYAKVEVPDIVPIEKRIQRPLEQWLRSIQNAQFVATDSFHACVFSVIFGKPFVVVQNPTRGNGRIGSLLKIIEEEFRLVSSVEEFFLNKKKILSAPQTEKLEKMKEISVRFLERALS